jgi:polyisoprenoid-binding protein YceI
MNRNLILGIAILIVLAVVGGLLYDWVLGEPLEASAPIQATPIELKNQEPTSTHKSQAPAEATATEPPAQSAPTEEPVAAEGGVNSSAPEGFVILSIVPEESEARFNIYELLNGQDKDVIGVTNQIAGEVAINPDDLSQVQFGTIQVNARTFITDEDRRNNAIRNRILNTDQYEFITFTPTAITGLNGAGQVGQSYTFEVAGNLTIRDVTQPVTFQITLQAESDNRLNGTASATIKRSDFNLVVPSVPFVANVADEIALELDLVMIRIDR